MGTNISLTVPVADSAAADAIAPALYVGLDVDRAPFRPPETPRRGWRIVVGATVTAELSVPAAATADAVPPSVYVGEDPPGGTVFPFLFPSPLG